jgi:hypothetical protein
MPTKASLSERTRKITTLCKFIFPGSLLLLAAFFMTTQAHDAAAQYAVMAIGLFVLMHHIDIVTHHMRNLPLSELIWHSVVILPCIWVTTVTARRTVYTYMTGNTPSDFAAVLARFPPQLILFGLLIALVVALLIPFVWRRMQARDSFHTST